MAPVTPATSNPGHRRRTAGPVLYFVRPRISRKPGSRWWPPFLARRSVKRDVVRLGVVFRPGQRILADGMPFHELDGECIAGNYLSGQRSLQGFVAAVAGFTWQRMCEIVLFQWVGTVRFICRATLVWGVLWRCRGPSDLAIGGCEEQRDACRGEPPCKPT